MVGAVRTLLVAIVLAAVGAPAAAAGPLRAQASLDSSTVRFGDAVRARVSVVAGPDVRPGSVRVTGGLAPLTTVSPQHVRRVGDVIEVTRTVTCNTAPCVAENGVARPRIAPARVSAVLADGRTVRVTAAWPQLTVRGRVSSADLERPRPPFRSSVVPPAPTYRSAPATMAWLLDGAAIVLALAAAGLLVAQVRRRVRRRSATAPDQLERALRLARESEQRPAPDRRRAVGLLARLLDDRHATLAGSASELAWSRPQPEPDALESLVGDVERERRT